MQNGARFSTSDRIFLEGLVIDFLQVFDFPRGKVPPCPNLQTPMKRILLGRVWIKEARICAIYDL